MSNNLSIVTSRRTDQCLITGQPVTTVMDLGQHAYADTFVRPNQFHLSEPVFPLQVCLCADSGMIQLGYVSPAQDRYNLYAYSYTSSNSAASRRHWQQFADDVMAIYRPQGLVLEIGSNDGYLLEQFRERGCNRVLGVDGSAEMCGMALKRGILTRHAVFDDTVAQAVIDNHEPVDLVIANNVFNHANDPLAFARSVARVLSPQGIFVFEVPYWLDMMRAGRFPDMIYHEHVSYFTVKSLHLLLKRAGLAMRSFSVVDYHGGSLRVIAQPDTGQITTSQVQQAIEEEQKFGLFDPDFYQDVMRGLIEQRRQWLADFYDLFRQDPAAKIIGVGAAAKANTWLTWHGLGNGQIHAITDASEFKQGKFTPLTRIPITDDQEFARHDKPYALILSWNIGAALKGNLLKINSNTRFISQ